MEIKEKIGKLSELKYLKKEVDMISQQIAQMEMKACPGKRISGLPLAAAQQMRLDGMRLLLEKRRDRCMEALGRLYEFIDGIEDSVIRQIMTHRYIDGHTWQQIAFEIGEYDEQYPRRMHNRFLKDAQFDENDEAGAV